MKNVISFFQTLLPRQALIIFLAAFTFLAAPVFSNSMVASAETVLSPEGVYYKGTPDGSIRKNGQNNNKSVFDASEATKNNSQNKENQGQQKVGNSDGGTVLSPEGVYYKGIPDDSIHNGLRNQNNKSVFDASEATKNNPQTKGQQKSENPFKEAVENVREKLNLDEEVPRSTKEFLKSTEERVEETVEPITGTSKGYYQIP
jgi:hypothetical protein